MRSASCRAIRRTGSEACSPTSSSVGKAELPVGGARCRFLRHGAEFEARLRNVAGDPRLSVRIGRSPCARAVPVIDEPLGGRPVRAAQHSPIDLPGESHDLVECRALGAARRPQQMQRHRLVQRQARDAVRPLGRDAQRDTAAIGVPDEVHRTFGGIDDVDHPRRLVGGAERMRAGPVRRRTAADQVGRDHVEARAEHAGKAAPLVAAGARAVQRDDDRLVGLRAGAARIVRHGTIPAHQSRVSCRRTAYSISLRCSPMSRERAVVERLQRLDRAPHHPGIGAVANRADDEAGRAHRRRAATRAETMGQPGQAARARQTVRRPQPLAS